jgi:pilus assembly protein CpaE
MESSSDRNEKVRLHGVRVAILAQSPDQQRSIQERVEATRVARVVLSHLGFPISTTDPIIRQIQDQHAQVVIIDVPAIGLHRALDAIDLIQATTNDIAIFAMGETNNPSNIIEVMRAGACEYLDRHSDIGEWLEAFTHFSTKSTKKNARTRDARVFTIINAKGGTGATTVAVNTALALQQNHGQTVLIDFAPIGHAALHLNLRPRFGISDALQNLHRMDFSLLDGLMTSTNGDLHLLAGLAQPNATAITKAELARLFDLLVDQYRYVVVDCSGRMDSTTKLLADISKKVLLVAQMDVVSLWSAGLIRTFLQEALSRDQLRIVLNRYKKVAGFTDGDVEQATGSQVFWKLPNSYESVALGIDKGRPVVSQNNSELSRSFRALAALLAAEDGLDWTGGSVSPPIPPLVPVPAGGSGGPQSFFLIKPA